MDLKEDEMQVLDQTGEDEEEENEPYMTLVEAVEGRLGPVECGSAPQPGRPGPSADGPVPSEEEGKKEGVTPVSTDRQSESTSAEGQKGRSVSAPSVQQLPPATKTETQKKKKRKQEEEREIPVVVEKPQEVKEADESPTPLVIDFRESPQTPSVTESQGAGTSDREGGETEGTSPSTDTMVKQLVVETPLMTLKKNEKKEKPTEEQENEVRMTTPPPVAQQEQGMRPPLRQQQLPQPHEPGENQDLVPVAPIPITRTEPLHRPISSVKPPTAQIPPLVTQKDKHLQFSSKPSVYTRLGPQRERTYQRRFESYRPPSQEDRTEAEQRRGLTRPYDRRQEPNQFNPADLPPIPNHQGDFPTIPPPWKGRIRQDQDEPYEWGPLRNYPYQAEMIQQPPYINMRRPTPAAAHYEHINTAPPEPLLTPPDMLLAIVVDNNLPNRNPEHAVGWPTRLLHMVNEVVLRVYHTLTAKKLVACEAGGNRIRMEFLRELCQHYQNFLQQAAENTQYSAMEWEILLRFVGKKILAMLASLLHQKVASDKRFERSETRSDSERSTASRVSRTPEAARAMLPNQQDQEAYELWLLQHPDYAISPAFPSPQDIQQQGRGAAPSQGQPSRPIPQPQTQQDLLQLQYQQASAPHLYPPAPQQQEPSTQGRYQQVPAAQQPPQQIQPQWQTVPQQTPMNIRGQQQPECNWVPQQQYPPVVIPLTDIATAIRTVDRGTTGHASNGLHPTGTTTPSSCAIPANVCYNNRQCPSATNSGPNARRDSGKSEGNPTGASTIASGVLRSRNAVRSRSDWRGPTLSFNTPDVRSGYNGHGYVSRTVVQHGNPRDSYGLQLQAAHHFHHRPGAEFICPRNTDGVLTRIRIVRHGRIAGVVQRPRPKPATNDQRADWHQRRIMGQRQGDDKGQEKGKGKAGPSGGQGR